ncbi:unnamed protein product [Soboliphyme baturini]|uniref:AF4/FMR2 family member lilli n=1 Tax=Soboliphyme baturini TaxID=241478 RepID=A0A183J4Y8_9BILA|nr:unnamed protein product [Soboliphyme baturini]
MRFRFRGVAYKHFSQAGSLPPKAAKLSSKIDALNLRVQSILCRKLFELRQSQAISNYRHINQYQRSIKDGSRNCASAPSSSCSFSGQGDQGTNVAPSSHQASPKSCSASAHSPTPSPASSTGSSQSLPPGLVAIPQNVEALYKQQLSHLHNLMWAHHNWQLSDKKLKSDDKPFFDHLDRLCGALNFNSGIGELSVYVITAVDWLKLMHGNKVV